MSNGTTPGEGFHWTELPRIDDGLRMYWQIKLGVRDPAGVIREQIINHIYQDLVDANEAAESIKYIHLPIELGQRSVHVDMRFLASGEKRATFDCHGKTFVFVSDPVSSTFKGMDCDHANMVRWWVQEDSEDGEGKILYKVEVIDSYFHTIDPKRYRGTWNDE